VATQYDAKHHGCVIAQPLCGWKTRAMFERYNIIDEADLAEAVAKRFRGQLTANERQTTANTGTPTASPSPLSSSPA